MYFDRIVTILQPLRILATEISIFMIHQNDDYTNNVGSGVVQIVENRLRKYVCFSDSFNMEAASAACRQVGFEKAIKFGRSGYGDFSRYLYNIM